MEGGIGELLDIIQLYGRQLTSVNVSAKAGFVGIETLSFIHACCFR